MLLHSRPAAVQPIDHVCVLDAGYGVARPGGVEFAAAGRVHYYLKRRAKESGYLIGGVLFGIEVDFVVLVSMVSIMPLRLGAVLEGFTIDKTHTRALVHIGLRITGGLPGVSPLLVHRVCTASYV